MERYVVSRPLAEKLKAAGYPQQTVNYWCSDDSSNPDWHIDHSRSAWLNKERDIAAPMTDELMEQLPKYVEGNELGPAWLKIEYPYIGSRDLSVSYATAIDDLVVLSAKRWHGLPDTGIGHGRKYWPLVDVLAELYLWCVENGYLKGDTHAK